LPGLAGYGANPRREKRNGRKGSDFVEKKRKITRIIEGWKKGREKKRKEKEVYDNVFNTVYDQEREKFLKAKAKADAKLVAQEKQSKDKDSKSGKVLKWLKEESKNWGTSKSGGSMGEKIMSPFDNDKKPRKKGKKKESVFDVEI
jgi:hypothetical protein